MSSTKKVSNIKRQFANIHQTKVETKDEALTFRGYRHEKEKTENQLNLTSVLTGKRLKHLDLTALGNNCL